MTVKTLVVDDSALQRTIVSEALDDRFEVVAEAENGKDAIRAFASESPDFVTMDIMMPEMNGIDATAAIKDRAPGTPVVMVTSVEQREKMKEAVRAGADDYVTKPVEAEELLAAIEDVLDG